jgi:hypothetical protein
VDPFQTNIDPGAALPPHVAHAVAIRFGLTVADVRVDARDVATWSVPDQQLLTAIEHRRRLAPTAAATYLETLRRVLLAD